MRLSYLAPTDFPQASICWSLEKEKAINKREGIGPQYCQEYCQSVFPNHTNISLLDMD